MRKKVLSAFPYYGGKNKMANLICEMLNYKDTSIYIEPFGGGCRTLLNKPRHEVEIYNDSSFGLCAFFNLMSKKDTAEELIHEIYKTEYSKDCFEWALKYRNNVDDNILKQTYRDIRDFNKKLLVKYNVMSQYDDYRVLMKELKQMYESKDFSFVKQLSKEEVEKMKLLAKNYNLIKKTIDEVGYIDLPDSWVGVDVANLINDIDLGVATYVLYSQSRDAMGNSWTSAKFKTQEAYYRQVDKLYDVAERFNGVNVFAPQNALTFLLESSYINREDVCMYLDPSYLSPQEEVKAKKENKPRNLGKAYKQSFDYEDHKVLLELIKDTKAKILISNYDAELYNEYLTNYGNWRKLEFETSTSLASGDKNRTEILWYNY